MSVRTIRTLATLWELGRGRSLLALVLLGLLTVACNSRLVIHTGTPAKGATVRAFLGEGQGSVVTVDAKGDAVFESPSTADRATVSAVSLLSDGGVSVTTIAGNTRDEVWFPDAQIVAPAPGSPVTLKLSGTVTGVDFSASVQAVGGGYSGQAFVEAGAYTINLVGPAKGRTYLLATSYSYSGHGAPFPTKWGLVPVDIQGTDLVGVDVTIDRSWDEATLPVSFTNDGAYGSLHSGMVNFSIDGADLVGFSGSSDGSSLFIQSIKPTPPFDVAQLRLSAAAGAVDQKPSGLAEASTSIQDFAPVTLALLSPLQVTNPALLDPNQPNPVPAAASTLSWNGDASAQDVEFDLNGLTGLRWRIYAPMGLKQFNLFNLPAAVSPISGFPSGAEVLISASSHWRASAHGYADVFGPPPAAPDLSDERSTLIEGSFSML